MTCSPLLDAEKSDPLVMQAINAGFTLDGVLAMHLSPIVLGCDEGWIPLLERIEKAHGYVYEWVPTEDEPPDWRPRWGMAVLTYIG